MAERKGFEPLRRLPAYTLSRRAPSTTRPSLRRQEIRVARRLRCPAARERREGAEHPSKGAGNILIDAPFARSRGAGPEQPDQWVGGLWGRAIACLKDRALRRRAVGQKPEHATPFKGSGDIAECLRGDPCD